MFWLMMMENKWTLMVIDYKNYMETFIKKYKKQIVITSAVILLQVIFGFDPKFTIINLIWLIF